MITVSSKQTCFFVAVFVAISPLVVEADDVEAKVARNQRQGPPPTLSQVVSGKIDVKDGKPRLVLMLESFRTDKIRIETTRRMFRVETAENASGDENEEDVEEVEIQDPIVVEREITQAKPAGLKPKVVDLKDVKFFDLNWNEVSIDQASSRLKRLAPVFLLDANRGAGNFPPSQLRALNPDCLILQSRKRIRENPNRGAAADPFGANNPFGGADPFGG